MVDKKYLVSKFTNIVIQINGKKKDLIKTNIDITEDQLLEQIVKSDELLLNLDITNGLTTWQSLIDLNVEAGMIIVDHVELINNLELSPGEQSEIKIFLEK